MPVTHRQKLSRDQNWNKGQLMVAKFHIRRSINTLMAHSKTVTLLEGAHTLIEEALNSWDHDAKKARNSIKES